MSMRRKEALAEAASRLAPHSPTPRLDAELLMAYALGVERGELLLEGDGEVPADFASLVARREAGEPIAYIIGRILFHPARRIFRSRRENLAMLG
jgi:release factor glutamine methyltransferase